VAGGDGAASAFKAVTLRITLRACLGERDDRLAAATARGLDVARLFAATAAPEPTWHVFHFAFEHGTELPCRHGILGWRFAKADRLLTKRESMVRKSDQHSNRNSDHLSIPFI